MIQETIPKLETFNESYSGLLSTGEDLLARVTASSVSAISSDGLEGKGQQLQVGVYFQWAIVTIWSVCILHVLV